MTARAVFPRFRGVDPQMTERDFPVIEGELLNILDKKTIKRVILASLAGMGLVVILMIGIVARLRAFNSVERVQALDGAGEYLRAEKLICDGWVKEMPDGFAYPSQFDPERFSCFNDRGINTSYGRTVEFRLTNLSDIEIHDWNLVIPISDDMYINKAWNGEVEFSQFGGKNTDRFNTMQAVPGQVGIESAVVYELTLFPVAKGDRIIYYPNADYREYPITGTSSQGKEDVPTTIGIIFYTTDEQIDLSGAYIRYHLNKTVTQLPVFWGLAALLVILGSVSFVSLIVILVGRRYERVQREANENAERALGDALRMAEEANRAKTTFLSNMSHDIRTPMNAIIGFTNIALKQEPKPEVRECLDKIRESSDHLLTLINDVLDISRIESGKTKFKPVPVDLTAVADVALNITRGFLSNRDIQFNVSRAKLDHPYVLADAARIREVLVNILGNAVKFTEDGGTITFEAECRSGGDERHIIITYRISDTGIGMSPEFLEHIFDEFSQEESSARTQYKGTGLGMAITKRYVELMGGTISVDSRKGVGSTFTVELPMELTDGEKVEKQDLSAAKADLNGIRILMAEDNDLNAEIAIVQMEECGMTVTRAANGQEAVRLFSENPPDTFDIILMDIMMPVMNGYEATRTIRSMAQRPDSAAIPIVAMTANAFAEDVQASLDAGMNAHIAKPIVMDEVIKTIAGNVRR